MSSREAKLLRSLELLRDSVAIDMLQAQQSGAVVTYEVLQPIEQRLRGLLETALEDLAERRQQDSPGLWDQYAAAALTGLLPATDGEQSWACTQEPHDAARYAAQLADAMLEHRQERWP